MKINFFTFLFLPHNTSIINQMLGLSRRLVKLGNEVTIYTTRLKTDGEKPREEELDGILVKRFPVALGFKYYFITPELLSSLNKIDGDVTHVHGYRNFQADCAHILKILKRAPLCLSPYGSVPYFTSLKDNLFKALYDLLTLRVVLRSADAILAETNFEKTQIEKRGIPGEKIRVVHAGCDLNLFKKSKGNLFGTDERVLLYVGRIERIKGLGPLIRVFSSVKKTLKNTKLILVGPCADQRYLAELRTLATNLNLDGHVTFHGPAPQRKLPSIYSSADLLVLPSIFENIGTVLLEAQACECPVVATNVGGVHEVLRDGETGFLVKLGDTEMLAACIQRLLQDDDLRKSFGKRGRAFISQNFPFEIYADKIVKVYEEILT